MVSLEKNASAVAPAKKNETFAELENLPALFGRLGDDVVKLLDTKLTLLKVEVKEDANVYARGAAFMGVGGLVAATGLALANIAVAFLLSRAFNFSEPINYALGFAITGIVYLVIGGAIILIFKNRLARRSPVPNRSVEELRKDKLWLKKEI